MRLREVEPRVTTAPKGWKTCENCPIAERRPKWKGVAPSKTASFVEKDAAGPRDACVHLGVDAFRDRDAHCAPRGGLQTRRTPDGRLVVSGGAMQPHGVPPIGTDLVAPRARRGAPGRGGADDEAVNLRGEFGMFQDGPICRRIGPRAHPVRRMRCPSPPDLFAVDWCCRL